MEHFAGAPMNQLMDDSLSSTERTERLAVALIEGLYLVNAKGEILCVLQDVGKKARPNGLQAVINKAIVDASAAGRAVADKFSARHRDSDSEMQILTLDELTERERQVLGLICEGQDDQAMSETLGLSPNTVRNHIAALYRRIGVNRRAAAILWAQERGITCDDALTPRARKAPRRRQADPLRMAN